MSSTGHRHASVCTRHRCEGLSKGSSHVSPDPSIADKNASVEDWVAAGDDEATQRHASADQAAGPVEASPPKPARCLQSQEFLPKHDCLVSCCFMTNIDWLQRATRQSQQIELGRRSCGGSQTSQDSPHQQRELS
jgi:hypothetical protein